MGRASENNPKKFLKHIKGHIPNGGTYLQFEHAEARLDRRGSAKTPMVRVFFDWKGATRSFVISDRLGLGGR